MEKVIQQRTGKKTIGFGAVAEQGTEDIRHVTAEDLVKFGIIPELVGRLPVVVAVDSLTESNLVRILTEPKNALVKQYQTLLKPDGVALEFTPGALEAVARKAIERCTGARGLRAVMEEVMLDIMYDPMEGSRYVITSETVLRGETTNVELDKRKTA